MALGPEGVMSLWLWLPGFTALTAVWFLASTADGLRWLQGQLESSAALPGPTTRDQSRQWWCPEQVVGARAWSKGQGQLWGVWQLQQPWLLVCDSVAAGSQQGLMAVEACDSNWVKCVQLHSWRDHLLVNTARQSVKVDRV